MDGAENDQVDLEIGTTSGTTKTKKDKRERTETGDDNPSLDKPLLQRAKVLLGRLAASRGRD